MCMQGWDGRRMGLLPQLSSVPALVRSLTAGRELRTRHGHRLSLQAVRIFLPHGRALMPAACQAHPLIGEPAPCPTAPHDPLATVVTVAEPMCKVGQVHMLDVPWEVFSSFQIPKWDTPTCM